MREIKYTERSYIYILQDATTIKRVFSSTNRTWTALDYIRTHEKNLEMHEDNDAQCAQDNSAHKHKRKTLNNPNQIK